ncbi:MAG: tetratricopeptide repeat protein [Thermoanaerobaculia bacterium]
MSTEYPGNPALPSEVRQRVLTTFKQTLDLYNQGLLDDVVSGCEFLLKMDPLFAPAKKLLEKARNPAAPIDIAALAQFAPAAAPAAAAPSAGADLADARTALDAREFQRASDLAAAILRTDMTNEEAQRIAEEASEKLEAEPFIQQFAAKARQQIANGQLDAARVTISKGDALDPDHPLLVAVRQELEAAPAQSPFDPVAAFGAAPEQPARPQPEPEPSKEPGAFDFGSFSTESKPGAEPSFTGDSFVVDGAAPEAPAGGGPSAPASDFGFTFEEDAGGPEITIGHTSPGIHGFAGETPQEAAEAVSGDTFDFSTASVEVSQEDQTKIDGYLEQGDEEYAAQNYQSAIDIWSRIFLIDVTNDAASERIERARAKKMEIDREVDDTLEQAEAAAARKDVEGARRLYQKILESDPSNAVAIERLALLDVGPAAAEPELEIPAPAAPQAPARPATRASAHPFDEPLFPEEPIGDLSEEVMRPPEPGIEPRPQPAARAEKPARTTPARSKTLLFAIVGLVALVVVGAAGWLMFGGGDEAPSAASSATLQRAAQLAEEGRIDEAIDLLRAMPPDDPGHDAALSLLADLQAKKSAGGASGRPGRQIYDEQVRVGRAAFAANDFLAAKAAFEQAASIQPLPPDVRAIYEQATAQASQIESAQNLFRGGNYRQAIAAAQAILERNPMNANARDLIARAHFNLGVQALQNDRLEEAVAEFDQVLAINPNDELAQRARELAIRYQGTNKDLLYRIFVKYLQLR